METDKGNRQTIPRRLLRGEWTHSLFFTTPAPLFHSMSLNCIIPHALETPDLRSADLQLQAVKVLHQHTLAVGDFAKFLNHSLVIALPLTTHGPEDALCAVSRKASLVTEYLHSRADGGSLLC